MKQLNNLAAVFCFFIASCNSPKNEAQEYYNSFAKKDNHL